MKKNQSTERPSIAVKPICWGCKYGIVTFQQNKEIHSKEVEVVHPEENEPWKEQPTEQTNSMFMEHIGYFTTCTWLCQKLDLKVITQMPDEILLKMPHIIECNRFERETNGVGKDEAASSKDRREK